MYAAQKKNYQEIFHGGFNEMMLVHFPTTLK